MKKRDLLFAGLLLFGASAFAQPTYTAQDAKVIFTQDFEADWDAWSSKVIDSITTLQYYDHTGTTNGTSFTPWKTPAEWQKIETLRTDSLIYLMNGIKPTDNEGEIKAGNFAQDTYGTEKDPDTDGSRAKAMKEFGENGGQYILHYHSDSCTLAAQSWGTYKGGYTANYRRNMFVRGLEIEPNTSYRLTLYVKAKNYRVMLNSSGDQTNDPRMSAGVFRGYYQSEKPFSMGLEDDADHYKYKAQFEYTKTDFTGEWEKVTYMTYYLNDSIANNFVFVDGYWWADGAWTWPSKDSTGSTNPKEYDLNYIVQPDKFFVRIGFLSDYTDFYVDNLSLTKSWIAGAEFNKDKIRINFGYKTNLAELAVADLKATGIDAVEVVEPHEGDYFEVWCLKKGADPTKAASWEDMPIRSAEYHKDGYMYMFTEYYKNGQGEMVPFTFDAYDKVLVTFKNPVDNPKLALKYTGTGKDINNMFPNALDTNWIKAGKLVPNFFNEIATPNPTEKIWRGVYSMKDLPPVLQNPPYENGSFGLTSVDTLAFKFSRKVLFDNTDATTKAIAKVNGVRWTLDYLKSDSSVLILRKPQNAAALNGDAEITIKQLYGVGTEKGNDIEVSYHFGDYSRVPQMQFISTSNWRSYITDYNSSKRPWPTTIYACSGESKDPFGKGLGNETEHKIGLYPIKDDTLTVSGVKVPDNCLFYLSNRKANKTGNLYCIEHLTAGNKAITFKLGGQSSTNRPLSLYFYAKPEGELTFDVLEGVANKTVLEKGIKPSKNMGGSFSTTTEWAEGIDVLSYTFKVPAEGDYVFEFVATTSENYEGVVIGNYYITTAGDLSFGSTSALNKSVEDANARIVLADKDKGLYTGSIYTALTTKIDYYKVGGAFDAAKKTKPSEWAAAKKDLDDATALLKSRMDTVDKFVAQRKDVTKALTDNATKYSGLAVYTALKAKETEANAYDPTVKTGKEIYDYNDAMKKAIDALNARIALNTKLDDALAKAAQLLKDSAQINFEEYPALKRAYDTYKVFDAIAATDDGVNTTIDAVKAACVAYQARVTKAEVAPRRIRELAKLAADLGSTIADTASIKSALENLENDDDMLADVFKLAIKLALYEKLEDDVKLYTKDSLDLTPFIKNYYLYQTPKIADRSDKNMPDNNKAGADANGANMQYTQHKWNSGDLNGKMPIWVMITEVDYTDLYPGWTARAFNEGNCMVTGSTDSYQAYKDGLPIFDGEIGMDWNGKATLKTDVYDLPVGMYTLGVQIVQAKMASGKGATLNVTASGKTYTNKTTESVAQAFGIDSIMVDGKLAIDFELRSENGWSRADNFYLYFRQDKSYDYEGAKAALKERLAEVLTIVEPAKAFAADAEYFTLGGVQVAEPKAGQILIRKSKSANGKVTVDKVLLK